MFIKTRKIQNTKIWFLFLFPLENSTPLFYFPPAFQNCHCLLLAMRKKGRTRKSKGKIFYRKKSVESKHKCVNKTLKTKDDNKRRQNKKPSSSIWVLYYTLI